MVKNKQHQQQLKSTAVKDDALKSADAAAPPPPEAAPAPAPPADAKGDYLISLHDLHHVFGESTDSGDGELDKAPTTAESFERLQQALGVQHAAANPRSAAWADLCFSVLCFARSRESYGAGVPRFRASERASEADDEKALLALTIADEMFQFAVTPAEQEHESRLPTLEQCYDRFRTRVREASCVSPPAEEISSNTSDDNSEQQPEHQPARRAPPTLSTPEVASFVAFMAATFFRHLATYQFVFRHTRASVTRHVVLCIESPLPPAPLASATPLLSDDDP